MSRENDTGALYRERWARPCQRTMRSESVVVAGVRFQDATQMRLAQDNHMIEPISRLATPFCYSEAGAVGLSRMPIARGRRVTTARRHTPCIVQPHVRRPWERAIVRWKIP
jgi:hypothetical protein